MEYSDGEAPETLCACAALRGAARSVTQLYDLVLQPSGLRATQFIALKSIAQAGEIAQWKYARDHAIAVETLSRRLAALRKRGLVWVRKGTKHGERIYALTEQGKRTLSKALPYWQRAEERLHHTLGDSEFRLLLDLCRRTVVAAHQAEQLRAPNCPGLEATSNSPADSVASDASEFPLKDCQFESRSSTVSRSGFDAPRSDSH